MVSNKVKIYNSYIPENNTITDNPKTFTGAPPNGFMRLKSVPEEASRVAKSLLSKDYGTITPFDLDNRKFVARVEPHYHDPKSGLKPSGWHKGVTVYESKDTRHKFYNDEDNKIPETGLLAKLDKFLSELS